MARRTNERLSMASSSSADGYVDDDRTLSESWLCRSTVCASDEEHDDGSDAESCSWSQLQTPTIFSVEPAHRRDSDETSTWAELNDEETKQSEGLSSNVQSRKGKRRLPLLSGFSSAEALRAQLPRSTNKPLHLARSCAISKDNGKISSGLAGFSSELSPSEDEIEASRRKWDVERKLQGADRSYSSEDMISAPERKPELRRKLQTVNPVAPTAAEVDENRRKWDLERRLRESDRTSVDSISGPDRKHAFRCKLQSLNPFAMKMNPVPPSAAEVEANQRKWDQERRLEDASRIDGSVEAVAGSNQACDLARKLPPLHPKLNPVVPSAAEVEANRRKWDLERRLQDGSVSSITSGLRRWLQNLNPLAMNPIAPSAAEDNANRRKWDLERRLQDGYEAEMSARQLTSAQKLTLVASSGPAKTYKLKRDMENELWTAESQLELKMIVPGDENAGWKLQEALPSPRGRQTSYEMNESLVYLLLFSSTAVLHCAIFNFNLELRQFLRMDIYPFGILLLLSWTFVGLIQFVGGLVGDLVRDRVLLLQRNAVLWGTAVVAFQFATFNISTVVTSMCLVSGLLCAGVAHGILCPNVIALNVESKFCKFQSVSTPLSAEEGGDSSSGEEENDGDDDSAAESEASYLSDVSTATTDEHQQETDFATHNFFIGCFAARLAGSSLVQGYYFLLVGVDMFADVDSEKTMVSRGIECMLLMSFGLMASLICFCYQSWGHRQSGETLPWESGEEQLECKLAILEQGSTTSVESLWTWSWTNLIRLYNRALVGYALSAFVVMALIGVVFSLVVVILASQTSLSVRFVAFLLIVIGWLLAMVASSRQLNPTNKQLLRECRRFGLRSRQLYLVIFAVAFICVSGCVAFLRAQLYTTLPVQVCQTRLLIPGTTHTFFDPELLGTAVGIFSLVFLGLSRVVNRRRPASQLVSLEPVSAKLDIVALSVPATPVLQKPRKQSLSLPSMASYPPAMRMCFAMLLYLTSVFLSSVMELYRRRAGVSASPFPRSCGEVHSEFTFLWASPYVVLFGASDALFRVSLQESCHDLAQVCFASSESSLPSRRWAGTLQGAISLAEALGYTTALSLVAMLSGWLFRPEPTDMALLFLLLTAMIALTHAVLKRIATRAHAYQRVYFSTRLTT